MFIFYITKEVILGKFSSVIIHYKISLTGRKSVFGGEKRLKNVKYRVAPQFQGIYKRMSILHNFDRHFGMGWC